MNQTSRITFAFLALAVTLIAAHFGYVPNSLLFTVMGTMIAGAVTITYLWPTNLGPLGGGNVAPTAAQMISSEYNTVVATIVATAITDTSAVITHNFPLSNAEISQGWPQVNILETTNDTSQVWELSENTAFTVLGLPGLIGGVRVFISRPHTIVR